MSPRRQPIRCRARSVLLWAIVGLIACDLAGGVVLDYARPEARFPTAAYLFGALSDRGRTPDLVALGSSRIGLAFSATEAGAELRRTFPGDPPPTVFNAAIPSGDFATADFVLRHMLRQGRRPAIVVVEVTPELVNRYNEWIGFDISRLFRWNDLPTYLPDIVAAGSVGRLLVYRLFPLWVYREEIRQSVREAAAGWLERPVGPRVPAGPELRSDQGGLDSQGLFGDTVSYLEAHAARVSGPPPSRGDMLPYQHWMRRYEIGGTATASFERLLTRCRDNDIAVVLVAVPLSRAYREYYTPEINAAFAAYMATITRKYGCRFVDYRELVPDRLFFDHTHIVPEGSRLLTRTLLREAVLPMLARRASKGSLLARRATGRGG